jgi:hypothetical protein
MTNLDCFKMILPASERSLAFGENPWDYGKPDCSSAFAQTFGKDVFTTICRRTAEHTATSGKGFHFHTCSTILISAEVGLSQRLTRER